MVKTPREEKLMGLLNLFFRKLRRQNGESLAETLVATLIAAMSMMVLAGALMSSAKANKAAGEIRSFAIETDPLDLQPQPKVKFYQGENSSEYDVNIYAKNEDDNKNMRQVYYYEIKNETNNE